MQEPEVQQQVSPDLYKIQPRQDDLFPPPQQLDGSGHYQPGEQPQPYEGTKIRRRQLNKIGI